MTNQLTYMQRLDALRAEITRRRIANHEKPGVNFDLAKIDEREQAALLDYIVSELREMEKMA